MSPPEIDRNSLNELPECSHCGLGVVPTIVGACPFCQRPLSIRSEPAKPSVEGWAVFSAPYGINVYMQSIPIAGRGQYRITDEGIEFSGFEERRIQSPYGVAAILAMAIDLYYRDSSKIIAAWPFFLLNYVPGRFFASQRHPLAIKVPWTAIRKIEVQGSSGQIQIKVSGMKPSGIVYFKPVVGPKRFLETLPAGWDGSGPAAPMNP